MKMSQRLVICGVVAGLCFGVGALMAQDNNGGGQAQGGRGNFDPAQFRQRMMDNVKERFAFTNETEWAAVQPLVQKVMDARREAMAGMRGFGRRNGSSGDAAAQSNDQAARRGSSGQPSPEAEALQKAIDDNAPLAQIKAALEKYRAAHKDKQTKLAEAQENLRKVLTVRQEAQAALLGLVE